VKKAKLDLIEEMPDIELAKAEEQPPEEEVVEGPVKPRRHWALNKLLLIGAPVALVLLIISGIGVYFLYTHTTEPAPGVVEQKAVVPAQKPVARPEAPVEVSKPVAVSEVTRTIYFKDFLIDLKDNQGNNRILSCDVAFDVVADADTEKLAGSEDLRNAIYRTAQSRGAVALKSAEERGKMKKDLADQLDKLAGKSVVRKVYFANYFIM